MRPSAFFLKYLAAENDKHLKNSRVNQLRFDEYNDKNYENDRDDKFLIDPFLKI